MGKTKESFIIFNLSGFCYVCIEMAWRGYSHWTMFFTGGICFLILVRLFQHVHGKSLIAKCVYGALVITAVEFFVGCIVNIWLNMNVWDYSSMPFNVLGQVCLLYSLFWGILSIPIAYLTKIQTKRGKANNTDILNNVSQ